MKKIFLLLFLTVQCFLFSDPLPQKDWTFMIFMNGDNNLDPDAFDDFNELEKIGSNDWMNIIVQYDRYESNSDARWSTARRYYVNQDSTAGINSQMIEDMGELDSGDYNNVINFVNWAAENYPATNYGLIIWNHGSGWQKKSIKSNILKEISNDDTNGGAISVAKGELEQILIKTKDKIGKKLEFLGFDACLMAMWEVMFISKEYTNYFAGSEETENAAGWIYNTLFGAFVSGEHTAENFCGNVPISSINSVGDTLSCVNLQLMEPLNVAIENFAVFAATNRDFDDKILQALSSTLEMYSTPEYKDLYDFFYNLKRVSTDIPFIALINPILTAIDGFVVENRTSSSFSDAKGVTIYMPIQGYYDSLYNEGRWSVQTHWDEFIRRNFNPPDDHANDYFSVESNDELLELQSATIEYTNDIDYFYLDTNANTKYTFSTQLLTLEDSFMYLFDSNGTELLSNDDITSGDNRASKISWKSLTNQRVYIAVKAYSSETGTYKLVYTSESDCVVSNNGVEICDGKDNDCDGTIDVSETPLCELENASVSVCQNKVCKVSECEENFYNIDADNLNGCEYSCTLTNNGTEICDGIDNDCDGIIDDGEDICLFPNGGGVCTSGTCELVSCEPDYYNNDSNTLNGCEYNCIPSNQGLEICDEIDNNCDGKIDEGVCKKASDDGGCSYGNSQSNHLWFFLSFMIIIASFRKIIKQK